MVIFSETEAPVKIKDIADIEYLVGLKFPTEYREHILRNNGGKCHPNRFTFSENAAKSDSIVDWFLAIYDGEYDSLRTYSNIYKIQEQRLPFHILPIAHDPGGNLICISCGTRDYGYVYFWDHEKEVDNKIFADNNYFNLYLIAKNLLDFFDGLE
ncbi:SMI1/KNR4 family protein [Dyadobacter bucti]|uniref:SMI1/KNR4 family protein n=1 Tax=Dyadobacter bucti TaxID=2572203 RepID=UPI001109D277|nr:SMI1/KNR4 family protein [Dyadobacter bucti]